MIFLSDPLILEKSITSINEKNLFDSFGSIELTFSTKENNNNNEKLQKNEDFNIKNNLFVNIIEYIEIQPLCKNGLYMPLTINNFIKQDMKTPNIIINKSNLPSLIVEDNKDLPIFFSFDETDSSVIILENNVFSAALVEGIIDNEHELMIAEYDENNKYLIFEIDHMFISGHIQYKIPSSVTFPKNEDSLLRKEINKRNYTIEHSIDQILKKSTKISINNSKKENAIKKIKKKKIAIKKKLKRINSIKKLENLINEKIKTIIDSVEFIQIKKIRESMVKYDIETIANFFAELKKTNCFTDENNMFLIIYAASCFPFHNKEMIDIFKKIEDLYNNLNWNYTTNFLNISDENRLGKEMFLLSKMKIFKNYFQLNDLNAFDKKISDYVDKIHGRTKNNNEDNDVVMKEKDENETVESNDLDENDKSRLKWKKNGLVKVKKKIVGFIYGLENSMLKRVNKTIDIKKFKNYFDSIISNSIDFENNFLIDLDTMGMDEITFKDEDVPYTKKNLREAIRSIKNSNALKEFNSIIEKRKKRKRKNKENRKKKKISDSNILFPKFAKNELDIHPEFKNKILNHNTLEVFLNFEYDKDNNW